MNNVNRGGPSSTMLIIIGLITICLLSAYATATWPFAMREGYRQKNPNWSGAPGRVSTGGLVKGPYKPGGGRPKNPNWSGGLVKGPYKPGGGKPGTRPKKSDGARPKRPTGPYRPGGGKPRRRPRKVKKYRK